MTSIPTSRPTQLIWATRGRSWGFRFLLDAGLEDPLPEYERAFAELSDEPSTFSHRGSTAALRLSDPAGRKDLAGRLIPHEFVLFGDLADTVGSVREGVQVVWPMVDRAYARIWDAPTAPTTASLEFDS